MDKDEMNIQKLKNHLEFKYEDDCYILMAITRRKYIDSMTDSSEIVFRDVIQNKKQIITKYYKMKALIENYKSEDFGTDLPFYLYVTQNARSGLKTMKYIHNKLNDLAYQAINGADIKSISTTLKSQVLSAYMKPENRSKNRYFLVDLDTQREEDINKIEQELENTMNSKIITKIKTENGYHFKFVPCNLMQVKQLLKDVNCEIKKDGLMFISSWNIERFK